MFLFTICLRSEPPSILHHLGGGHFPGRHGHADTAPQRYVRLQDAGVRVLGSVWHSADVALGHQDGRLQECHGFGECGRWVAFYLFEYVYTMPFVVSSCSFRA